LTSLTLAEVLDTSEHTGELFNLLKDESKIDIDNSDAFIMMNMIWLLAKNE
jgi:hypothetical protein